jgi:hypothetical protein
VRKDELLKPDFLNGALLLGSGLVMVVALLMVLVSALRPVVIR